MGKRPRHLRRRPPAKALAPLGVADFRRLWIAQTVSIVGDKINQIALSIMVFQVTGSYIQMGIVFGLTFLPAALFGLIAGPLVDRWDWRRTMIIADVLRAAIVGVMALVASSALPKTTMIAVIYVLAFVSSTASVFFEPSRMAIVPSVVAPKDLLAANALDMTTLSVSELLGIAFGGALVTVIGYAPAFIFDAATFVVSAVFVVLVSHRSSRRQRKATNLGAVWDDLRSGIGRIRGDGVLRGVVFTYAALALCGGASITLTVLLALDLFRDTGIVLGGIAQMPALGEAMRLTAADLATTIGVLAGSVLIGSGDHGGLGRKYLWGIAAFGLLMIQFLWVPDLWVALLVLAAAGVANQYFGISMIAMLQSYTEPDTRGRVFAVRLTIARVATVVGLAGAGVAAQVYGVREMTAAVGVLAVVIALLGFSMPRLRNA